MEITENIARKLIDVQFPGYRNQSIVYLGAGMDNANFRLGAEYLIRLPIRKESANLMENEIRWLPFLEPNLPIKIPAPNQTGQPTDFYPWPW
ncbi:MAG TPA: hypothetical protein PLB87_07240, partial [Prolixibacteraceae bacterium]|nr:hypothetical protein [Prolixibacteraceae bacterium]